MSSFENLRIASPEFLSILASAKDLPPDVWYLITAVTLSSLNRPEEITDALRLAISGKTHQEQTCIARRIREALIKSAPVVGLPKTINSLLALKRGTPIDLQELPSTTEPSSSRRSADFINVPASEVFERGKSFFDTVYGSNSDKLMKIMDLSGTPDLGASGRLMYAYFLSNTNILNGKETMFVTMTGMLVIDVQSTLLNHMKGAINHGATLAEVNAVRSWVMKLCKVAGMSELQGQVGRGRWGWRDTVAKL